MLAAGISLHAHCVRPKLKTDDVGKFAAIDIESGDFALDADERKACHKLRKRIPDAQIWMVRVGYRFVHRFGGRDERRKQVVSNE